MKKPMPAARRRQQTASPEEPAMPLRDADLRGAASREGVRPGDEAWSLLVELQRRRDAEREG